MIRNSREDQEILKERQGGKVDQQVRPSSWKPKIQFGVSPTVLCCGGYKCFIRS